MTDEAIEVLHVKHTRQQYPG
ncbi:hypothetical protein [Comamonas sp. SCN 65-56]|nr:hypothetical protein [Comamonas sp. SCN 65-56]